MPFDADLVLLDGTVALLDSLDTPPISVTRDATTGAVVIDLKETGVKGLAAVLVLPDNATDADTVTAYLEAADHVDMTGTPAGVERLGSFGVANATQGVILGSETPCVAIVRFVTDKRYVRLNLTVGAGDLAVSYAKCLISPYPFKVL